MVILNSVVNSCGTQQIAFRLESCHQVEFYGDHGSVMRYWTYMRLPEICKKLNAELVRFGKDAFQLRSDDTDRMGFFQSRSGAML